MSLGTDYSKHLCMSLLLLTPYFVQAQNKGYLSYPLELKRAILLLYIGLIGYLSSYISANNLHIAITMIYKYNSFYA